VRRLLSSLECGIIDCAVAVIAETEGGRKAETELIIVLLIEFTGICGLVWKRADAVRRVVHVGGDLHRISHPGHCSHSLWPHVRCAAVQRCVWHCAGCSVLCDVSALTWHVSWVIVDELSMVWLLLGYWRMVDRRVRGGGFVFIEFLLTVVSSGR
jgi:hypothetical protein